MQTDFMLTTKDNPFSPFNQFEKWRRFDEQRNYNTLSYLARIANTSSELPEYDEVLATQIAIDEIVRMNILGIYMKVQEEDYQ